MKLQSNQEEETKLHKVLIISGLGDNTKNIEWATNHYKKYGLKPFVYKIGWRSGEKHFKPKLQKLVKLIDKLIVRKTKFH